ncbi:Receptor-type guanylate cyclase gcy [Seminavis robusta]|uniref:Receptor-type guanylate cyclase gcy n=1 Tax=Seminavis robusta TaxID=568900 RepID=A0A9N8DJB5_9STRA|nr:Receptor-type guanylate cyclase gcy [Seminavis robusta]|eukprot:Sro118_g057720.1 Receptor-type guanylate cyclase gcy (837) ;mRNA; r:48302-51276
MTMMMPKEDTKTRVTLDGDDDVDDDGSVSLCGSTGGEDDALAKKKTREADLERQRFVGSKETVAVAWLRVLTFGVLLVTALIVCLGVYFYTRNDEQQDFEYVFESSAERVIQSFHTSVARIMAGGDAMSVAITSYALDTGATFPFVTIPNFELRGANTRILTKSIASNFFPLIHDKDRPAWEDYVTRKITQDKIQFKSFMAENQYVAQQDKFFGLETVPFKPPANTPLAGRNFSSQLGMLKGGVQPNGTGPYLAFYQTSPVLPAPALPNLNILTFPPLAAGVKHVLASNLAYLSKAVDPSPMFHMFLARGQYRHQKEAFLGDAATPFIYPVFDSFPNANNNNNKNRTLVGVTLSNIYWRLHFENILPPNARGIVVVLSNNANQTFTYQINGADVDYLGKGDLHDAAYDDYGVSADISQHLQSHASVVTQAYTAVPIAETGVQYQLHIYPSAEMAQQYISNEPILFGCVVALVFVFTSIVFLFYNHMVERRQRAVVDRAVKSAAVVSNLFPEQIKEELINNSGGGGTSSTALDEPFKLPGARKEKWTVSRQQQQQQSMTTRPKLAQKHPHVTVLFADIAGFTSWSSDRDPEDVFVLLETFYAAFDALAAKREVFKVETIGDCYLACTGMPNAQPDHAMRMCKFARDCLQRVNVLTSRLAPTLGQDTLKLGFRVGLHSGAVTAGVLKSDKARYQIFGDTVNTAARMESNGLKGKIHMSEETFKQLVAQGKENILVEREEKIFAKGKGHLQTYFLSDDFVNRRSETATFSQISGNNSVAFFGIEASERKDISSGGDLWEDDDVPYAAASALAGESQEIVGAIAVAQQEGSMQESGSDWL